MGTADCVEDSNAVLRFFGGEHPFSVTGELNTFCLLSRRRSWPLPPVPNMKRGNLGRRTICVIVSVATSWRFSWSTC